MHDDLRQHNQGFTVPGKGLWFWVCSCLEFEADPPPCILVIDEIPSYPQIKCDVDREGEK